MEFLRNEGFTEQEISKILDKYDKDEVSMLCVDTCGVIELIRFMKEYGIKNIPKLMFERLDIFYLPKSKIEELFSHYEKDSVILALDYDSSFFDEIR